MKESVFWSRVLGLYLVIIAIGSFLNHDAFYQGMLEITEDSLMLSTMGVFTLILGLAIIVSHSVWRSWAIVVTLIGYWVTFEGIMLLFIPEWIKEITLYWSNMEPMMSSGISLALGVVLLLGSLVRSRN